MVVQSLADSASGGHVPVGQDHVGAVKKPFHPFPNLIPHHLSAMATNPGLRQDCKSYRPCQVKCFQCEKSGHIRRNCKARGEDRTRPPVAHGTDVGSVEQEPTSITTPKAPSLRKGNVTLHVAGKDLRLSPPTSIPAAANLTKLDCLGVTTIKIGHVTKPAVRVLVVRELSVSAILGLDVLHDYERMSVNRKNQTLVLGGHLIKLEK
ncbi:Retrovirus-related Pol poly from transposon [Paramuricea clavata]|uniref:Retrovirus-related Pol poly from transposon n=1 Tax=Paramuricea clavata TaxID=317549 RepID=A0A7D9HD43_PARCT|nr:Retrovirus-related Pol poly from transposon [Paramuricea clavata]